MKSKRLLWADVVRIIAIYLVLVVHNTRLDISISSTWILNLISFAVAKTCVPLFVMLSGAILLDKNEGYFSFFKKRFSRYIVPWLFWSLISAIILLSKKGSGSAFFPAFKSSMLSFWFLPMISCLYLITPIVRKVLRSLNKLDLGYFLFLWFLGVSLLPYAVNSPAFQLYIDNSLLTQTVRYSGYYLLGYFVIKNNLDKKIKSWITNTGIVIGVLLVLIPSLNNPQVNPYLTYYSPGIILGSVCGFIFLKKLADRFSGRLYYLSVKIIAPLSKASLEIYLIHQIVKGIFVDNFGITFFTNHSFPTNYLNSSVLLLISYFVIFTLKKIPIFGIIVGSNN